MIHARKIAISALVCAMLIAVQYVFSAVKGVELVTVFFFAFCFSFGAWYGITVAVCYSLLRCFLFGFFPNVTILYLVYYTLFAVVAAVVGRIFSNKSKMAKLIASTLSAILLVIVFSLLDDLITPIVYSYNGKQWQIYIYQSLPVMLTQGISAAVSTLLLFLPLEKVFARVKK